MKRLSSFILAIFILAGITGCSKEYNSERCLYKATRLARNIFINPEAIPPQEFNKAVNAYTFVFERYPDTWSAKRARMAIGSLYLARKEYPKARDSFEKVLDMYADDKNIRMEAQFAIAKSYEIEGVWQTAVSEYRKIIDGYPETDMALSLPMHIAVKENSYDSTIAHYRKISEEKPDSEVGFKAENFIVKCYLKNDNWEGAVKGLERLIMDYPMAKTVALNMRMAIDISLKQLNMPGKAIEILERFLERYPGHPLKDAIKKWAEELKNASIGR